MLTRWKTGAPRVSPSRRLVASTLAFVELVRKWDELAKNRLTEEQLVNFIFAPPEWFFVSPLEEGLFPYFADILSHAEMPSGKLESIEWTDAVHLATAKSRDKCKLVTSDQRILQVAPDFTIKA